MSTGTESKTEATQSWNVFLCYRQVDGTPAAEWLNSHLAGRSVPTGTESPPSLKLYFDQTAPAVSNWHAVHRPALEKARAMIVVCTPAAYPRMGREDWVHEEIDWWVQQRRSAPILVDTTGEGGRWLPEPIRERWPNAQRIELDLKGLAKLPAAEREKAEERVLSRILGGIAFSESLVRDEELERKRRTAKQLKIALGVAVLALIVALWQWSTARVQKSAAQEAKRSVERTNEKLIDEQGKTMDALRQSEENLDRAIKGENLAKLNAENWQAAEKEARKNGERAEEEAKAAVDSLRKANEAREALSSNISSVVSEAAFTAFRALRYDDSLTEYVRAIRISPSNEVAHLGARRVMRLLSDRIHNWAPLTQPIDVMAFLPTGDEILTLSDKAARRVNWKTGEPLLEVSRESIDVDFEMCPVDLHLSPRGSIAQFELGCAVVGPDGESRTVFLRTDSLKRLDFAALRNLPSPSRVLARGSVSASGDDALLAVVVIGPPGEERSVVAKGMYADGREITGELPLSAEFGKPNAVIDAHSATVVVYSDTGSLHVWSPISTRATPLQAPEGTRALQWTLVHGVEGDGGAVLLSTSGGDHRFELADWRWMGAKRATPYPHHRRQVLHDVRADTQRGRSKDSRLPTHAVVNTDQRGEVHLIRRGEIMEVVSKNQGLLTLPAANPTFELQTPAAVSPDGKHVVDARDPAQVSVWKVPQHHTQRIDGGLIGVGRGPHEVVFRRESDLVIWFDGRWRTVPLAPDKRRLRVFLDRRLLLGYSPSWGSLLPVESSPLEPGSSRVDSQLVTLREVDAQGKLHEIWNVATKGELVHAWSREDRIVALVTERTPGSGPNTLRLGVVAGDAASKSPPLRWLAEGLSTLESDPVLLDSGVLCMLVTKAASDPNSERRAELICFDTQGSSTERVQINDPGGSADYVQWRVSGASEGDVVAMSNSTGAVWVYNATDKKLRVVERHSGSRRSGLNAPGLSLSPDGRKLQVSGNQVSVHDLVDGRTWSLSSTAAHARFSEDGTLIVLSKFKGPSRGDVRPGSVVWSVPARRKVTVISEGADPILLRGNTHAVLKLGHESWAVVRLLEDGLRGDALLNRAAQRLGISVPKLLAKTKTED